MIYDEVNNKRYQDDPDFHAMVNMFVSWLYSGQFNMVDIKTALNFAITKFHMEHSIPNHISQAEWFRLQCSKECKNYKCKNK